MCLCLYVIVLYVLFDSYVCVVMLVYFVRLRVCACPGWCDHRLRVASPQRGENASRDKPPASLQRLPLQAP